MLEKVEVCRGPFHGFDSTQWVTGTPQQRLSLLPAAQEHVLPQTEGKPRLLRSVTELSQAFALAVPHADALAIRDEVGFYQAVRAVLSKGTPGERKDASLEPTGSDARRDRLRVRRVVPKRVSKVLLCNRSAIQDWSPAGPLELRELSGASMGAAITLTLERAQCSYGTRAHLAQPSPFRTLQSLALYTSPTNVR